MTSMKIGQFSRAPTPLVHLRPKFFHPLDLGCPISNEAPSPIDKQSIKRKHNPSMTFICYQVLPSGRFSCFHFQYQFINIVWLSFNLFSFSCSLTFCFFVALYSSCVCSCPKFSRNVFYL